MMNEQRFRTVPWQLMDDRSWQVRRDNVFHPRVSPINKLVEKLRIETQGHVPWVDPFCGGVDARVLMVLKRPGALGAAATNFLSLGNDDITARNTIDAIQQAGLRYEDLVFWNAIPWYASREEAISTAMRKQGAEMLRRLLPLLPNLRVVLLVGKDASYLRPIVQQANSLYVIECPHTSPLAWNQKHNRHKTIAAFKEAATRAGPHTASA